MKFLYHTNFILPYVNDYIQTVEPMMTFLCKVEVVGLGQILSMPVKTFRLYGICITYHWGKLESINEDDRLQNVLHLLVSTVVFVVS